jgi:hypothetical protein
MYRGLAIEQNGPSACFGSDAPMRTSTTTASSVLGTTKQRFDMFLTALTGVTVRVFRCESDWTEVQRLSGLG